MDDPKAFITKELKEFPLREIRPLLEVLKKDVQTSMEIASIMNFFALNNKFAKAYAILNVKLSENQPIGDSKATLEDAFLDFPAKFAEPLLEILEKEEHTRQEIAVMMNSLAELNNTARAYAILGIKLKETMVEVSKQGPTLDENLAVEEVTDIEVLEGKAKDLQI